MAIADRRRGLAELAEGHRGSTLEGPFAAGNTFIWTAVGLAQPIVSTIYSVEAKYSILWIAGVHRWTFDVVDAGTRVTTEEVPIAGPLRIDNVTIVDPATAASDRQCRSSWTRARSST